MGYQGASELCGMHTMIWAASIQEGNMNKTIKNILKLLLIGFATTIVRIIGQLSIPAGEQTVLADPAPYERKPDFTRIKVRPCLLRSVDRLFIRAFAPCGSP